jgi:eukaryotic-like serine/threonine-protein kinase
MSGETNERIGDYEILGELGCGGMGRVWRVRNVISDRIEAMKVLLPDLAGRQELAARFLREIKLMASLDHPNIAALRTAFTANNQLYMVMEFVEGQTMAEHLENGPISVPDALNYTGQVLKAVSYAHHQHIIHRDIKPPNMMLTPQGTIKLMDFGIARAGDERSLTRTGTTLGSLNYMSPEQVKGEATDGRSDLYSVGVCLYEFVTGQRPFTSTSGYSLMAAQIKEIPKPPLELNPALPLALNEIILMAIAKEPAKRFQTADAFNSALSNLRVTSLPSLTAPPDAPGTATSENSIPTADVLPNAPTLAAGSQDSAPVAAQKDARVAAPETTPAAFPPAPQPNRHRGVYITMGALIVLAVLVIAGLYAPRSHKAQADTPELAPSTSVTPNPEKLPPNGAHSNQPVPFAAAGTVSSDSTQPPALPTATTASVENSNPPPSQAPLAAARETKQSHPAQADSSSVKPTRPNPKKLPAQNDGAAGEAAALPRIDEGPASPAAPSDSAQLDELERAADQLSNRAEAVNSSLDHLRQQQNSAGFGLRGDMVARQASMKANLSRAEEAIQHGDLARTKKYLDLAGNDVEVLERFLGH